MHQRAFDHSTYKPRSSKLLYILPPPACVPTTSSSMSFTILLRTLIFGLCVVNSIGFSVLRLSTRMPLRPASHQRRPAKLQTVCASLKIQTPLVKVEGYAAIRDILGGLPMTGGYTTILELFNKFDKDLSGKIEPVELQQTMREMGVALTDDQACINFVEFHRRYRTSYFDRCNR